MKRSTAIGHLVEMAEVASQWLEVGGPSRWPLSEMWVTGELLTLAETLDSGAVVLVLDLPVEELPWLAMHPTGESIGHQLRLGKRPIRWCYRPRAWPVWNCQDRRLPGSGRLAAALIRPRLMRCGHGALIASMSSSRPPTSLPSSSAQSSRCRVATSDPCSTTTGNTTGGGVTRAMMNRRKATCGGPPAL